ncbi:MAG: hypothetical protein ACTS4T_01850 [Candidatus Hodgkinia cicadicola]
MTFARRFAAFELIANARARVFARLMCSRCDKCRGGPAGGWERAKLKTPAGYIRKFLVEMFETMPCGIVSIEWTFQREGVSTSHSNVNASETHERRGRFWLRKHVRRTNIVDSFEGNSLYKAHFTAEVAFRCSSRISQTMLVDVFLMRRLKVIVQGHEVNYSEVGNERDLHNEWNHFRWVKGTTERRKWLKMLTCGECADGSKVHSRGIVLERTRGSYVVESLLRLIKRSNGFFSKFNDRTYGDNGSALFLQCRKRWAEQRRSVGWFASRRMVNRSFSQKLDTG